MVVSLGKVALPPGGTDYVRQLLDNPRTRSVAARIVNGESEKLLDICVEVAEESLHRRPADRRTRESLEHGPEYHDSFEVVTAKEQGYGPIKAGVRNLHPFAEAVEKGTPPHQIRSSGKMEFPWNGLRLGPNDGPSKGNFDVSGPIGWVGTTVNHPGAGAKRVMARARRRYLDRSKRALNRP